MLSLPIGYMKFLCSKTICHHFWPRLITPLLTGGTYLFINLYRFQEQTIMQNVWDKVRWHWEHIVHLKNMSITHWELDENTLKTLWEQQKFQKSNILLKRNKMGLISPCYNSQWLKRKSILNCVHHLFWLRAIVGAKKNSTFKSIFSLPSFFGICVAPRILGMVLQIKVINNDI